MVHFGYSNSSLLLLHGCQGESILSSNGLRQGDPLSSLLFSLYTKDVYSSIGAAAPTNDIYAFIDDLNIVGTPDDVVKAFEVLLTELQKVGLKCNFSKTQFIYFHDHPLDNNVTSLLDRHQIQLQERHALVLG